MAVYTAVAGPGLTGKKPKKPPAGCATFGTLPGPPFTGWQVVGSRPANSELSLVSVPPTSASLQASRRLFLQSPRYPFWQFGLAGTGKWAVTGKLCSTGFP